MTCFFLAVTYIAFIIHGEITHQITRQCITSWYEELRRANNCLWKGTISTFELPFNVMPIYSKSRWEWYQMLPTTTASIMTFEISIHIYCRCFQLNFVAFPFRNIFPNFHDFHRSGKFLSITLSNAGSLMRFMCSVITATTSSFVHS